MPKIGAGHDRDFIAKLARPAIEWGVIHGRRIEPVLMARLRLVLFRKWRLRIAPPADLQRLTLSLRSVLRRDAALQGAVLGSRRTCRPAGLAHAVLLLVTVAAALAPRRLARVRDAGRAPFAHALPGAEISYLSSSLSCASLRVIRSSFVDFPQGKTGHLARGSAACLWSTLEMPKPVGSSARPTGRRPS